MSKLNIDPFALFDIRQKGIITLKGLTLKRLKIRFNLIRKQMGNICNISNSKLYRIETYKMILPFPERIKFTKCIYKFFKIPYVDKYVLSNKQSSIKKLYKNDKRARKRIARVLS